ncbi:nitroreductase family protein [Micromonospora sp. DR5-3]|uniref:nitroreductase family protein n=1 Tax=unclassified Micromonospora TaxID=2617518 RepID=UPI0011DA27A5|nr:MULTISPECIES: nitroreductase family protein [unclassified Micromonospora]MCW3816353.1 nitroreductase family protein [Micromonospora sp. DR5-3]TYC22769.1 nitroreductase family protein [Micromonospora sp. MP36]
MDFQDVVRRRRMVRSYDPDRPVPPEVVERIVHNGLRAPSAGFSQGWGFLVLDNPADIARFRDAVRPDDGPENWFAARVESPLLIVPHSNKDAYLDRYAQPDKGFVDRSDAWWPAPYWDIDTGMASLLMLLTAVDAGLGACFFGMPVDRIAAYREAFGVPPRFTPIGAISIGYSDEPPRDLRNRRRPVDEVVHRGRWSHPAE